MRALFYRGRRSDFGDVDLTSEGLKIELPPDLAKRVATGFSPQLASALGLKGKAFIVPHDKIKDARIVKIKLGLGEKPFIELKFLGEKGEIQTITFATVEGWFRTKFKTSDFYEELKSKILFH